MIVLGCMDLDYSLSFDHPVDLSTSRSNRISLMMMQQLIPESLRGNNIREYIMEMSNFVTKLRASKLELSDDILVHLVLISLPAQFTQCVQKEDRLKQETIESEDPKPCFFRKKLGHMKKECFKYATWREKEELPKESSVN
ncbi:hypothetical protein R3W88_022750 [Solanum pinnatisectum]|uniref:Uncharacterized protein n=1 Tax=Solanum pinnatisectum TaxID=50273 RepID=A0AAV9LZG3_9SOLN|nr:hypothetical protein R3W88_022750 [Solanum pinnatisectum]